MTFLPPISGRVLVAGDVMTDIVVQPEGGFVRGSDRRAAITFCDGGSAANQAAWLAAAGVPVALFAAVGSDDVDAVSARLRQEGIEPMLTGDPQRQSGRLVTLVDTDGERSFFTDRGANAGLNYATLSKQWRAGTGLVVLSGYSFFSAGSRTCVMKMIAAARQRRINVVVDAASAGFLAENGPRAFLEWVEGATMLVANSDEAELLTGKSEPEAQVAALGDMFDMVIVKSGAEGSRALVRGGEQVNAEAEAARVVDTTGAGDAFLAGLIASWRLGEDLQACLAIGNRLGALAVSEIGGRPPHSLEFKPWS